MDYANRCPKRKHMQRYHSGRTRCQVNQEVASTDAPTPRIDSLQATPKDDVPVASQVNSRGPEVEDHHRYGVVHPGREPTDGHRLQRPHMNSSSPATPRASVTLAGTCIPD